MKQCPGCLSPISSKNDVCKVIDIVCRNGTFEVVAKSVVCRICGYILMRKDFGGVLKMDLGYRCSLLYKAF